MLQSDPVFGARWSWNPSSPLHSNAPLFSLSHPGVYGSGTKGQGVRSPYMPNVRAHLPTALRNHDIRAACTGVEHIMRAGELLSSLSPEALECVRDYCSDYTKALSKGPESEFKTAWVSMVVAHLDKARRVEAELLQGIGAHYPPDDD